MTYNIALNMWHDASIACVNDGKLELLLESERFSHIKHDRMSPACMVEFEKQKYGSIEPLNACMKEGSTHHAYHGAHAFYDSGFKEAVCVVVD